MMKDKDLSISINNLGNLIDEPQKKIKIVYYYYYTTLLTICKLWLLKFEIWYQRFSNGCCSNKTSTENYDLLAVDASDGSEFLALCWWWSIYKWNNEVSSFIDEIMEYIKEKLIIPPLSF